MPKDGMVPDAFVHVGPGELASLSDPGRSIPERDPVHEDTELLADVREELVLVAHRVEQLVWRGAVDVKFPIVSIAHNSVEIVERLVQDFELDLRDVRVEAVVRDAIYGAADLVKGMVLAVTSCEIFIYDVVLNLSDVIVVWSTSNTQLFVSMVMQSQVVEAGCRGMRWDAGREHTFRPKLLAKR